jgi:Tfp pilus assembly protein PilO
MSETQAQMDARAKDESDERKLQFETQMAQAAKLMRERAQAARLSMEARALEAQVIVQPQIPPFVEAVTPVEETS